MIEKKAKKRKKCEMGLLNFNTGGKKGKAKLTIINGETYGKQNNLSYGR